LYHSAALNRLAVLHKAAALLQAGAHRRPLAAGTMLRHGARAEESRSTSHRKAARRFVYAGTPFAAYKWRFTMEKIASARASYALNNVAGAAAAR